MTRKEVALSWEDLVSLLDYEPVNGILRWKITKGRCRKGALAGFPDRHKQGHWAICIKGNRYMLHRVIWFYHYRKWPVGEIDHQNMVGGDNRIENLREASKSLQRANERKKNMGNNPYKGVRRQKNNKWLAQVTFHGTHHWRRGFDTPEQAHAAYREMAKEIFGEYARFV